MLASLTLSLWLFTQRESELNAGIPALCKPTQNISVEQSFPDDRVDLREPFFYSSAASHSFAELKLFNRFSKAIRSATAVVDYIGPSGEVLVSVAFHSSTDKPGSDTQAGIHPEFVDHIAEPIRQGNGLTMTGLSQTTTAACPVRLRPTFIEVVFVDGSRATFNLRNWTFPPMLKDSPFFVQSPPVEALPRSSTAFRLKIDSSGHVASVEPSASAVSSIVVYASEQLKGWTFYPALANGHPVASELPILLRVNSTAQPYYLTDDEVPAPLVAIQLTPWPQDNRRWRAWYGSRPAPVQSGLEEEKSPLSRQKAPLSP